jgi:hypothetical protein
MLSREDNELLCRITQELRKARVDHPGLSRSVLGNLPAV